MEDGYRPEILHPRHTGLPTPGILFRDITPLLQTPAAFKYVVDSFVERYSDVPVDVIVAIEARGFLFGTPLAYALGKPLVPVRKEGKLPAETIGVGYSWSTAPTWLKCTRTASRPARGW